MNRRNFLGMLGLGIAAAAVEPVRTYFLPPPGGWTRNEAGGFFVPDDYLRSLKAIMDERPVERGAVLLLHPETIKQLRTLLDKHGRPLWNPPSGTIDTAAMLATSSLRYASMRYGPEVKLLYERSVDLTKL